MPLFEMLRGAQAGVFAIAKTLSFLIGTDAD
jgi:hypothetical protein